MIAVFSQIAAACPNSGFFGFPTWYKYLNSVTDSQGSCVPKISGLSDIWLIVAAVIDILLRISALVAVGFVVYGGVQYITSEGEPDKTSRARGTIINALIGLVIAVGATVLITFVASQFKAK